MKATLTLRPFFRIGDDPVMRDDAPVGQYVVDGLPTGQEASIAKMKRSRWHILRRQDGVQGNWTGAYDAAEKALEDLQREFMA